MGLCQISLNAANEAASHISPVFVIKNPIQLPITPLELLCFLLFSRSFVVCFLPFSEFSNRRNVAVVLRPSVQLGSSDLD